MMFSLPKLGRPKRDRQIGRLMDWIRWKDWPMQQLSRAANLQPEEIAENPSEL
jgi:hypothetical protein